MRGYEGRAPQGTPSAGIGEKTRQVLAAADLLSKLGQMDGNRKYTYTEHLGVRWVAYENGKAVSLVDVGELDYNFADHESHPYPVARFLAVPMALLPVLKVGLIVQFKDRLVARPMLSGVASMADLVTDMRVGHTLEKDDGIPQLVVDLPSESFMEIELA